MTQASSSRIVWQVVRWHVSRHMRDRLNQVQGRQHAELIGLRAHRKEIVILQFANDQREEKFLGVIANLILHGLIRECARQSFDEAGTSDDSRKTQILMRFSDDGEPQSCAPNRIEQHEEDLQHRVHPSVADPKPVECQDGRK